MVLISGIWRNRYSNALDRDSFLGLHFYPIWEAASLSEWLYNGGLLQGCVLRLADRSGLRRRPLSVGALLDACLVGPQVGHTWPLILALFGHITRGFLRA